MGIERNPRGSRSGPSATSRSCASRALGAPEAEDLRHWDVPFFAERLREARFDYSDEELRP